MPTETMAPSVPHIKVQLTRSPFTAPPSTDAPFILVPVKKQPPEQWPLAVRMWAQNGYAKQPSVNGAGYISAPPPVAAMQVVPQA